jgi:hypothetical protein
MRLGSSSIQSVFGVGAAFETEEISLEKSARDPRDDYSERSGEEQTEIALVECHPQRRIGQMLDQLVVDREEDDDVIKI